MWGARVSIGLFLAGLLLAPACAEDDGKGDESDGGSVAVLPGNPGCCKEEPDEDCAGCMATIGACCYDDATIFGRGPRIAAVCGLFRPCRACCNECAKMTCDQIKAANACPQLEPPDP